MKRFSVHALLLTIVGTLAIASYANATTSNSSLTVKVGGLREQRGQLCLSLFSANQGFPGSSERATESQCVSVVNTVTVVTFRNLNAGRYAIAVIHDANTDGRLNRGFLGIPTEGFGFSRNPKILTGPPSFGDAAISVSSVSTNIQIQLKYL